MQLTPDVLLRAYAIGIFPMAEGRDRSDLHWIDPELRGVLPLNRFHIPRSLRRRIRRGDMEVRCDTAFEEVIRGCAEPSANRRDTWINPTIEHLYIDLHRAGFAHSVETWLDGELAGGLYGVSLGAAFFGESMFSRATDASKVALVHLVLRLRMGGFRLLDTQFVTEHLSRFGAVEIAREDYRSLLAKAITTEAHFPQEVSPEDIEAFLRALPAHADSRGAQQGVKR
jgi:leucyl/phenylalanyl-tRNA---protein transferase